MRDLIRKIHNPQSVSQLQEFMVVLHKDQRDGFSGEELDAPEIDHQSILYPFGGLFDPGDEFLSRLQVDRTLEMNKKGTESLIAGDLDSEGLGNSSDGLLAFFECQIAKRWDQGLFLLDGESRVQLVDHPRSHR